MVRRVLLGLVAVMLAAAMAVASARALAVAAAGDQVVAAYRFLGRTWLLPVSPREPWILPLAGETVTLVPARVGGASGLYVVGGAQARLIALPRRPWTRPQTLATAPLGPDPVRRAQAADLDRDGTDELLVLRGDPASPPPESRPGLAGRLEVWQMRDGTLRSWWQGLERYQPWQLATGDVDGDGVTEWAMGAWTKAVYDPGWAERPWLYRWKDGQPFALWLGSRLAHPFTDFTLSPLTSGEPAFLVAVEATREGGQTLCAYRWNGFGFVLDYAGPPFQRVQAFTALPPAPGCAALAAVVEPGPALVLLTLPPAATGSLQELARHPVASAVHTEFAAIPGSLWLLNNDRLRHFTTCPTAP